MQTGTSGGENASYCTHGRNDSLTVPDYNTGRDTGDSSSHCIVLVGGNPTNLLLNAFFDSAIPGGVRISFDATTAGIKIKVILFAGLADAWIGTISDNAQAAEPVGASQFMPDMLVFYGGSGTFNTLGADCALSLGFAVRTDPIQQCGAFINFDDATEPTDADGEVSSTHGSLNHFGTTRASRHIQVDSFDAT